MSDQLKSLLRNLTLAALLLATAVLGWLAFDRQRLVHTLQQEIAELEKERRDLREQADGTAIALSSEQLALRQRIETQTSQLRGLAFKKPVNYKMISRSALRDYLVKKVHEQFTPQELHDYSRSFAALGLIPEGTDILKVLVSMYSEQVAAFYVPEERSLYTFTGTDLTSGTDAMLLSHELTHALQDQNFDLTTFALKVKDNDDLALATAALLEGDATVLMTKWYADHTDPNKVVNDLGAMLSQNTAVLRAAPAYLRDMLLFPYTQGQQFADALIAAGALDAAFRHPPVSSQQIIHPDLFLKNRRDPEPVELPKLTAPGWRRIGDNVLGEFGVNSLLTEHLDAATAQQIAPTWRGDRFHVYEQSPTGPTGLLWITVWADDQSAEQFTQAYRRIAEARHVTARIHRDNRRVVIAQSADETFFALTGTVLK